MAGNRRGKIKEHLEGCHRNFDWITFHLDMILKLVDGDNPNLTEALKVFGKASQALDEKLLEVYAKI